jgi:hypothetical protein
MTLDEFTKTLDPMVQSNHPMDARQYKTMRNLYIGINLNQPYKVAACNSQSQQTYNNSLEP